MITDAHISEKQQQYISRPTLLARPFDSTLYYPPPELVIKQRPYPTCAVLSSNQMSQSERPLEGHLRPVEPIYDHPPPFYHDPNKNRQPMHSHPLIQQRFVPHLRHHQLSLNKFCPPMQECVVQPANHERMRLSKIRHLSRTIQKWEISNTIQKRKLFRASNARWEATCTPDQMRKHSDPFGSQEFEKDKQNVTKNMHQNRNNDKFYASWSHLDKFVPGRPNSEGYQTKQKPCERIIMIPKKSQTAIPTSMPSNPPTSESRSTNTLLLPCASINLTMGQNIRTNPQTSDPGKQRYSMNYVKNNSQAQLNRSKSKENNVKNTKGGNIQENAVVVGSPLIVKNNNKYVRCSGVYEPKFYL